MRPDHELAMLDMADWFQMATTGSIVFSFGRGLYSPRQDTTRPGTRGPDLRYVERVHEPNRTEVLHGPVHVIRTTAHVSHTARMAAKDPFSLSSAIKQDSFQKHCISCANSILYSVGKDEIRVRKEPLYQYDDIDGYEPTLDPDTGEHLRLLDNDGNPAVATHEERIRCGSGLVERLGAPPYKWGMDAKWRLRYYKGGDTLRYMSNMQAPGEDCEKSQWRSAFRVEITWPEPTPYQHKDQRYWPGWRESMEWQDGNA